MDMESAFLNDILEEKIYIEQSLGFYEERAKE
jgi:hypothetical protein